MIFILLFTLLFCANAEEEEKSRQYVLFSWEREMFSPEEETLDLYVAPLRAADCMLLVCGGETMLVDTGKESNYPDVKAMLDDLGVKRLDYLFNSHPHDDHLGAFPNLAEDFRIGLFLTPFAEDYPDATYQHKAAKAAHEKGIEIRQVENEEVFWLGQARITMYQYTKTKDMNQLSGVLLVEFGERRLLLTADCSELGGRLLAETYDLHAELLKYPHHGIGYVFREQIEAINPEFTIIPHGHGDTKKTQKLLDKWKISYCFATWGRIHAATDGTVWVVEQELNEMGEVQMKKHQGKGYLWK